VGFAVVAPAFTQQAPKVMRVGASSTLALGAKQKESAALDSLKQFIKDETRFDNEIVKHRDWRQLAEKMASKELPLGVFQGYEYAWAQAEYPVLKPLMLAVKGNRYVVAYVVVRKDAAFNEFKDLQGKACAVPDASRGFPSFYLERLCQGHGKKSDDFFGKVTKPDNVEDALDDVVDDNLQGAVVDKAALEAFKRRKPGRFAHLKNLLHSNPVLPVIIAYADGALDKATLDKFRTGLLRASDQERGQTLLTMFRLTGFESPPSDFEKVMIETRNVFPVEDKEKAK
jgi:ABC-type phosphate/phosphonate transport system substrate-binding protein